jgi:predicted amidohydrolase
MDDGKRRRARRGKRVTVAAAQIATSGDVGCSTRMLLKRIDEAAGLGVDIVGFPEGALFGYTDTDKYWRQAKERDFAAAEQRIARRCGQRKLAAVFGTAYRVDGRWMNGLAIVDRDGRLRARYAKTFLAGETWCGNNRAALPVVRLATVPCCFIICHDVRYPELVRLPAAAGAQLCWYCSCESGLFAEYKLSAYRGMPIARAAENGIFLVMCNTPADAKDLHRAGTSHGNSKIIDPEGNVLAEAGYFEQRLVVATIDLADAHRRIADKLLREETILGPWVRQATRAFVKHVD